MERKIDKGMAELEKNCDQINLLVEKLYDAMHDLSVMEN